MYKVIFGLEIHTETHCQSPSLFLIMGRQSFSLNLLEEHISDISIDELAQQK